MRLRRRGDFKLVLRRGRRGGHGPLAVHVHSGMERTVVGFVVSRAVGDAVTRHRVTRQLRHLIRARYAALPLGSGVVIRALPGAAGRTSTELGSALDLALSGAVGRYRDRVANKQQLGGTIPTVAPEAATR